MANGSLPIDVRDPGDFEVDGVLIAGSVWRPPRRRANKKPCKSISYLSFTNEEWALRKSVTIARRRLLALVAGTLVFDATSKVKAQQKPKLSQADAGYQDTPKNDQKCSECTYFQPLEGCSVVTGKISPEGWCKLFELPPE
jgi:hypothetical protein